MTNEEALKKAQELFGERARITFDSDRPVSHRIWETYNSGPPIGINERVVGSGDSWEAAFADAASKSTQGAPNVPDEWIKKILAHCRKHLNKYVFQSKNPSRANKFEFEALVCLFGTTIESNRFYPEHSKAAPPISRYEGMMGLHPSISTFITIEPIMDFDVKVLAEWITKIKPLFVNIGADSKHSNLPEPPKEKILELVSALREYKIEIRKKVNLERILN